MDLTLNFTLELFTSPYQLTVAPLILVSMVEHAPTGLVEGTVVVVIPDMVEVLVRVMKISRHWPYTLSRNDYKLILHMCAFFYTIVIIVFATKV